MRHVGAAIGLALCVACGEPAAPPPEPFGERLSGAWGQNDQHATMTTTGLELSGTKLTFGELTITVTRGAATGPDDYRVDEAEVAWLKDDKPPRRCKGTLARQGNVLLVKLFRDGSETRCENVLDGEWRAWNEGNTLPASMLGIYGADARDEAADVGLRLTESTIGFTNGGPQLTLEEVLAWVDKPEEVFVRKSKYGDVACTGTIRRTDEELVVTLLPVPGGPPGNPCPNGRGVRWQVDPKHLPTETLDNGKVTLSGKGEHITLRTSDGLECTQQVLQTAARSVSGNQWDGIPVTGGAVLVLGHAEPVAGGATCTAKLRRLADEFCVDPDDPRCFQTNLAASEPIACPRQVVIGDRVPGGRKAALLPASVSNLACFDMTGMFVAK